MLGMELGGALGDPQGRSLHLPLLFSYLLLAKC